MPLTFSQEDFMGETFYLYSVKMQGWLTTGGSYVDDVSLAQSFGGNLAYERVRSHYDKHSKQFMLIPVPTSMLIMP